MNLRRLLLMGAVAWCGLFAALEGYRTVKLYLNRPWTDVQPSLWRLGSDPVVRLRAFSDAVDARLSTPTRLVFASPLDGEEGHILHMWAAYLLPRHDVVPLGQPGSDEAEYWLAYGTPPPSPPDGAALLLATENGSLWHLSTAGRATSSDPTP